MDMRGEADQVYSKRKQGATGSTANHRGSRPLQSGETLPLSLVPCCEAGLGLAGAPNSKENADL